MKAESLARYSRHFALPGMGPEGQEHLSRARVLLVGLGGLGCPASLYLAAAGVGTLGLADFDRVDTSNLQRQVLYTDADVGAPKLERAAAALRARNPELVIEPHPEGLTPANAAELLSRYDLVLDGCDNFATRLLVNDAAFLAGVPWVCASLFQFEAQLSVFHPSAGGPCYRCAFPELPQPGEAPNCAEAGVFGALCGVAGSLQALEALKWITGLGEPLLGHLLVVDSLGARMRRLRLERDPACPLCGDSPRITTLDPANYRLHCDAPALPGELTPAEAAALRGALFLDVREPFEWDICRIGGSTLLPLGLLPARADSLPRDRTLVVLCHHGVRSARAAAFLRAAGFPRVYNLAGGIDRWAREIDPSMNRY